MKKTVESDKLLDFEKIQFSNRKSVKRLDLERDFMKKINSYNVISVEGLKGSGKEHFVKSYFKSKKDNSTNIYLYCTESNDNIDNFFLEIEYKFDLSGTLGIPRYIKFFEELNKSGSVLIINKFHRADKQSFKKFIEFAIQYEKKITIILLSETSVDCCSDLTQIGRVPVEGFNELQLKNYLDLNNVSISNEDVSILLNKTGGYPFTISIFCYMFKNLKLSIDSLLELTDINNWLIKIKELLEPDELNLLQILSLCETPFNKNLSNYICNELKKLKKDEGVVIEKTSFAGLTKKYLIEKISSYRWYIYDIIAEFFRESANDKIKNLGHEVLGKYYYKNYKTEIKHTNDEVLKLKWLIESCHHFQNSGNYKESNEIVKKSSKMIKKHGFYQIGIEMCKNEINKNEEYCNWIEYHLAHFYYILGEYNKSKMILDNQIKTFDYTCRKACRNRCNKSELKLAMIRLYAEILNQEGLPKQGLDKINEEISKYDVSSININLLNQVKQTEAMLYGELGQDNDSIRICDELINFKGNKYSKAIGLTRKAIIYKKQNRLNDAKALLRNGSDLFGELNDERALAWSLFNLGIVLLMNKDKGGYENIEKAIVINSKLGLASNEYKELLNKLYEFELSENLSDKVNNELQRIKKMQIRG